MSAIETARLLLRPWRDDDLERLVALYGDPRVARLLSVDGQPWPRARSVGAFEHFRRQWQERGFGPWAAVDRRTGGWLGQIGLNELPRWPGPDKVEVDWDLHPSVWGQGLATEGARAALGTGSRSSVWSGSSARLGLTTPRPGGLWRSAVWPSRRGSPTRAPWLPGMPSTAPTGRPARRQPANRSPGGRRPVAQLGQRT